MIFDKNAYLPEKVDSKCHIDLKAEGRGLAKVSFDVDKSHNVANHMLFTKNVAERDDYEMRQNDVNKE